MTQPVHARATSPTAPPTRDPGPNDGPDERARADEADATAMRPRYRVMDIPAIAADDQIAGLLGPREEVLAMKQTARLDRRQAALADGVAPGLTGCLYLTSRRLVLTGPHVVVADLRDINDVLLNGERLLVAMRDGTGMTIDVDGPRLLRVEIAAARSALRTGASGPGAV